MTVHTRDERLLDQDLFLKLQNARLKLGDGRLALVRVAQTIFLDTDTYLWTTSTNSSIC